MMQVTEEVFLSEIHTKLNDLNDAAQTAVTIVASLESNPRERTPNGRSHSTGKVTMETPMRPQRTASDTNYQAKRTADNCLKSGQITQMHEMLLAQISKSESLMQDHAILQRTLYKYEQTLADLDSAFRNTNSGDMVSDLKRITEKQLKEIVMLQREIEMVKEPKRKGELDNHLWA